MGQFEFAENGRNLMDDPSVFVENSLEVPEFARIKLRDVKGTIRRDIRYLPEPNDVRRHRLISSSYI